MQTLTQPARVAWQRRAPETGERSRPAPALLCLRPGVPSDAAALQAMYLRCTPETRYWRFHGRCREIPPAYLREALAGTPSLHDSVVVWVHDPHAGTKAVGLGSVRVMDSDDDLAEVGLLIEDDWQRRGVGTAVLRHLAAAARHRGVRALRFEVLRQRQWMVGRLSAELGPAQVRRGPESVTATFSLTRPPWQGPGGPHDGAVSP